MENNVLLQLQENKITTRKAYKELYPHKSGPRMRRAHFVKLKIIVPEEKGVTRFLAVLFALPMPLFFVKIGLGFIKEDQQDSLPLPKSEMLRLISYRGIKISVNTKSGEKILIKTI